MAKQKTLSVRIDTRELERLQRATKTSADRALRAAAEEGVTIAKMLMTESPLSGRAYVRGSVTHIASSPGNPPRVDTGTLRASLHWEDIGTLRYAVMDGVEYGVRLEFGTREVAARPFMGPMTRELSSKIPQIFDGFLDD